jgi:hypothetical protein
MGFGQDSPFGLLEPFGENYPAGKKLPFNKGTLYREHLSTGTAIPGNLDLDPRLLCDATGLKLVDGLLIEDYEPKLWITGLIVNGGGDVAVEYANGSVGKYSFYLSGGDNENFGEIKGILIKRILKTGTTASGITPLF